MRRTYFMLGENDLWAWSGMLTRPLPIGSAPDRLSAEQVPGLSFFHTLWCCFCNFPAEYDNSKRNPQFWPDFQPIAVRSNVRGVLKSPHPVYWNIEKR
jgi:hypothetical protein